MKKFLAIYTGSKEGANHKNWESLDEKTRKSREHAGMEAWTKWGQQHAKVIVDMGSPLGKTKMINAEGVTDTTNHMAAYTIIHAETHEQAAKLFLNHPHFAHFPGDAVEIMECLPIPGM